MLSKVLDVNKIFVTNEISNIEGNDKLIRKCKKLSKIRKLSKSKNLEGKKLSKSQKLAKSRKKSLKNSNLFNFDTKKNRSSLLIPNARIAFDCL